LDCDVEFGGEVRPLGFAAALPFAGAQVAMVSGICADCLVKDDLEGRTMRRLRSIWPDLRVVTGGNA
jgi:hypothetical protein